MDSNTHSTQGPTGPADDLAELSAVRGRLASRDLERLADAALADQTLQLQQLSTAWTGSSCGTWPPWTPAGPPGPKPASSSAPPPAGCGPGCGWRPARRRRRCGPPGP